MVKLENLGNDRSTPESPVRLSSSSSHASNPMQSSGASGAGGCGAAPEIGPEISEGDDHAPASRSQPRRNAAVVRPRTLFGKSHSCLNAVTWTDRPNADLAGWITRNSTSAGRLDRRPQPCNPSRGLLVRQAVGHSWRLERAEWLEVEEIVPADYRRAARGGPPAAGGGRRPGPPAPAGTAGPGPGAGIGRSRIAALIPTTPMIPPGWATSSPPATAASGCSTDGPRSERLSRPPGRRPRWSRPSACWASGRWRTSTTGRCCPSSWPALGSIASSSTRSPRRNGTA